MLNKSLGIVFASHTFIGAPFVVGSHHISRELALRGHRIVHISTPVTLGHLAAISKPHIRARFRNFLKGGERLDNRLINYVPFSVVPWQLSSRFPGTNLFIKTVPPIRWILRRSDIDKVDLLIIDQPNLVDLDRLLRPKVLVYRATDLYEEMTGNRAIRDAERKLIDRADLLVGTSQPVLNRLTKDAGNKPSLLLENGVDFAHFSKVAYLPDEYRNIPSPRLVYVGALDERFDFAAIDGLARALSDVQIVLIGPQPTDQKDVKALASRGNVHVLGARNYFDLPGFLQYANVGLLPLSSHPANNGRSPMKLFEYGAAGLPVVATATEELERRKLPFVFLANSTKDFITKVEQILSDDENKISRSDCARTSSSSYSWASIAERLINFSSAVST